MRTCTAAVRRRHNSYHNSLQIGFYGGQNGEKYRDSKVKQENRLMRLSPDNHILNILDTIRNYRATYDKSCRDYKDLLAKQNAWQAVTSKLGVVVASARQKYNNIRTKFSKYIKSLHEKSGCGRDDVRIRPDLKYIRWLINHIKHRSRKTVTTVLYIKQEFRLHNINNILVLTPTPITIRRGFWWYDTTPITIRRGFWWWTGFVKATHHKV